MRKFLTSIALALSWPAFAGSTPQTFDYAPFGEVSVYGEPARGGRLAILFNGTSVEASARSAIAEAIANQGGLAATVDVARFTEAMTKRPDACAYNAWEFERLSQYLQKTIKVPLYETPILVGLGEGAALAYSVMTEAPDGTFGGLFVSGLCPQMAMPKKLCANEDETWERTRNPTVAKLLPADDTDDLYTLLPAVAPGTCVSAMGAEFFKEIEGTEVLPPSTAAWGSEPWRSEIAKEVLVAQARLAKRNLPPNALADLPLNEIRSQPANGKTMAIIITGDGGWAGLDRELADSLVKADVSVVGFSSLKFFWKKRTPGEVTEALARIIRHYTEAWQAENVILIGYSFGADALPFAVNRLDEDDLARVKAIALLQPGYKTDFEFNLGDWLGTADDPTAALVLPEILAMPPIPTLCAFGAEEEKATSCVKLPPERARIYKTEGGHHFDGDFETMAKAILKLLDPPVARAPTP